MTYLYRNVVCNNCHKLDTPLYELLSIHVVVYIIVVYIIHFV